MHHPTDRQSHLRNPCAKRKGHLWEVTNIGRLQPRAGGGFTLKDTHSYAQSWPFRLLVQDAQKQHERKLIKAEQMCVEIKQQNISTQHHQYITLCRARLTNSKQWRQKGHHGKHRRVVARALMYHSVNE